VASAMHFARFALRDIIEAFIAAAREGDFEGC
jgi:hypothetical protein